MSLSHRAFFFWGCVLFRFQSFACVFFILSSFFSLFLPSKLVRLNSLHIKSCFFFCTRRGRFKFGRSDVDVPDVLVARGRQCGRFGACSVRLYFRSLPLLWNLEKLLRGKTFLRFEFIYKYILTLSIIPYWLTFENRLCYFDREELLKFGNFFTGQTFLNLYDTRMSGLKRLAFINFCWWLLTRCASVRLGAVLFIEGVAHYSEAVEIQTFQRRPTQVLQNNK